MAALAKTAGIVARQVAHGQTNFARMIWKFGKVYNADRQYADHQREVRYQLPEPAPQPTLIASQQDLFVHVPSQERRRNQDQAPAAGVHAGLTRAGGTADSPSGGHLEVVRPGGHRPTIFPVTYAQGRAGGACRAA